MTHAIRIHETGGPQVLRWDEVTVAEPGQGEVLLRQTAAGLNFIDTYHRSGLYPVKLPAILGMEGAGIVDRIGPGVTEVETGDRVAYCMAPGAYAEQRLVAARQLIKLPESIDDRTAAALMLKGMTAHYLLRRTYPVKRGDTILIHAAAGGVGLIMCQWAKHLGARVIGTVGSDEKAALAKAHGCDNPIIYTRTDFVEAVKTLTGTKGVPVVYDSVGKDTLLKSMQCLQPRGMLVSFGQSSGTPAPLDIGLLNTHGSLIVTRPSLAHYASTRPELEAAARELFAVVNSGAVRVEIRQSYPLREAALAHANLEARRTAGSTILAI